MCADCHSTDVRKNYDPATDKFQTRWAEINVGCEACHGPGSRHLEWTKAKSEGRLAAEDATKGLNARLDERRGITWIHNATTGNAARSQPRATEREIEVCAQCHARRGQIAEGYEAGKPFLDYYRPALLTQPAIPCRRTTARRGLQLGLIPAEQDVRERRYLQRLP